MRRFEGKVAIVTGAASGIGRATARRLAEEGASVLGVDLAGPQAPDDNPQIAFARLDVADRDAWQALVADVRKRFGRLDVLVNCAGILREGTVESTDYAQWRQVMAVNLDGTFWGCQACMPLMLENDGGAIVNLSSVSGLKGDSDLVAYDASKGAVRLLSKEIALFCAARGQPVRCNSVHPGVVETPMVSDYLETSQIAKPEEWNQPNGRLIKAQEVAAMIAWLASSEAAFVTGAEYIIDGGMTA